MRVGEKACCVLKASKCDGRWWQGKAWQELKTEPRLADWMKEQLDGLAKQSIERSRAPRRVA